VERCDDMYTKNNSILSIREYAYCVKMLGESCTSNIECSFKNYSGICSNIHYKPSDSEELTSGFIK